MVINTGLYFAFDSPGMPTWDLTLFPDQHPTKPRYITKPFPYVTPYAFTHQSLKYSAFKFDRLPSGKFNVYGTKYNSPSPTKLIATWTAPNSSHFIPYKAGDENKLENHSVKSGVGIEGGPPKQRTLVVVTELEDLEIKQLKKTNADLQTDKNNLQTANKKLRTTNATLRKKNKNLRATNRGLNRRIKRNDRIIRSLKSQLRRRNMRTRAANAEGQLMNLKLNASWLADMLAYFSESYGGSAQELGFYPFMNAYRDHPNPGIRSTVRAKHPRGSAMQW
ncbi:hypothetical protein GQ44DRAFT_780581 [Phaeosphaeriaceae sp. PMI808]|nr:hypothetical protein GQ44DRAFT_780581 [Phaeosphaeriaceae sp. PMI808]